MAKPRYETFKDGKKYRWRFVAADGRTLFQSKPYPSKAKAKQGMSAREGMED